MSTQKPKIMISFRENAQGSGPYQSHLRITESRLKDKYEFIPLYIPAGHLGILNIGVIKNLVTQIRSVKPDIVHITGLELVGWYGMLACKISNQRKNVMAIHGSTDEAIEFNKNKVKEYIMRILEYETLKNMSNAYGVSDYVSSWNKVEKYCKKYFGTIYNLYMETPSEKKDFRSEYNLNEDDIIIVSTGRIIKEKGFEILKRIICENEWRTDIKFIIVGDGSYLKEMKEEIKKYGKQESVIFTGYRNDIENILSSSDIFVMCSLHETLCMSVLEACKASLPVVASDVGGIPEMVINGENGFLVKKEDIEMFTARIKQLVENKDLRNAMGRHALKITDGRFNCEYIIDQIDQVYMSILKG